MYLKEVMEYIGCSRNTVMKYKKTGILNATKDETGKLVFRLKEVKKIVGKYEENKDQNKVIGHKEDLSIVYKAPVDLSPKEFLKHDVEDKDDILDDEGKAELLRITEYLKEKGILDIIDKGTVMRYAVAVQMKEKFLKLALTLQDKKGTFVHPYFRLAKDFQSEVQHYEKELGLTAAAASKLNFEKPEVPDEMEKFLNG